MWNRKNFLKHKYLCFWTQSCHLLLAYKCGLFLNTCLQQQQQRFIYFNSCSYIRFVWCIYKTISIFNSALNKKRHVNRTHTHVHVICLNSNARAREFYFISFSVSNVYSSEKLFTKGIWHHHKQKTVTYFWCFCLFFFFAVLFGGALSFWWRRLHCKRNFYKK